jgi:uncharacterized membrane protein YidH (DUF202 family)
MRHALLRIVLSLALVLTFAAPATPVVAATGVFKNSCVAGAGDATVCKSTGADPLTTNNGIIHKATQVISVLAGIAAVLTIVWGGIQYITSEGNPEEVSKAKKTIIYAIVGIVVIVVAQSIINFVIRRI